MLVNELVSDTIKASLGKREDIHRFRAVQETQERRNKIKKQALDYQDSWWKSYSRLTSSEFVWKVCTKMENKVKGVWQIGNVGHMEVTGLYSAPGFTTKTPKITLWPGKETPSCYHKIT